MKAKKEIDYFGIMVLVMLLAFWCSPFVIYVLETKAEANNKAQKPQVQAQEKAPAETTQSAGRTAIGWETPNIFNAEKFPKR